MSTEAKLREQIVELGRLLAHLGLSHGSTGNISVRLDDGWLLTPTKSRLGKLDPARLAKLDDEGRHLGGDKPSKEAFLHRSVYDMRPTAGANRSPSLNSFRRGFLPRWAGPGGLPASADRLLCHASRQAADCSVFPAGR